MSAPNPRKRAAPGAAPIVPVAAAQQTPYSASPQEVLRWAGNLQDGSGFNDAARNANAFMLGGQGQYLQQAQAQSQSQGQLQKSQQIQQSQSTSTAIARRPPNRALIPSAPRATFDATVDPWNIFPDDGALTAGANGGLPGENESIEVLEERAQRIKKESQAKRKQIPPFVQKLSSFLEEQKNTELIRWSTNGDSFIVLDEDEFAKTLIPELFKHNNYASFVRQLNMYGFHKRVGLSDNSMKASERKNKSPSEYYNPYFKRGHPNLLWLINKPKSGSKSKKGKKEDGEGDSDEDGLGGVGGLDETLGVHGLSGLNSTQSGRPMGGASAAATSAAGHSEVVPLQKKDFQLIKDELSTLQTRQTQISKVMQRLQYDNAQLQQQARLFQNMHERHENSINAILNFLANVFRKSLEEQGGVQGVTELLASILPNGQMPTGSVVDVSDDFDQRRPSVATTLSTPPKRQQRLLPPIPAGPSISTGATGTGLSPASTNNPASSGRVSSIASSSASHASPVAAGGARAGVPPSGYSGYHPTEQPIGTVTEVYDSPNDLTSPSNFLQQELQTNPQEGMMKIIQDTNANTPTTTSGIDLPEVAASTPVNLSSDQRNRVLSLMSGHNAQQQLQQQVSALSGMGGTLPTTAAGMSTRTTATAVPDHGLPIPTANLTGTAPMMGPGGVSMSPQVPLTIPGAATTASSTAGTGLGGVPGAGLGGLPATSGVGAGTTSLSPILAQISHVPPPPSLRDISNTQAEIEALQRLQDEQNNKISDLSNLLGPLSPSGRIPGIDDDTLLGLGGTGSSNGSVGGGGVGGGQNSPGYFDLGQYLDTTAFGDEFNFATGDLAGGQQSGAVGNNVGTQGSANNHHSTDGEDFNFGLDSSGAGIINTPSPATTEEIEEIPRTDLGSTMSPDQSSKRRRMA